MPLDGVHTDSDIETCLNLVDYVHRVLTSITAWDRIVTLGSTFLCLILN